MSHWNPSRIPTTSMPERLARIEAAPITLLMPGAGPPPTTIASLLDADIAARNLRESGRVAKGYRSVPLSVDTLEPRPAQVCRPPEPAGIQLQRECRCIPWV